MALLRQRGQQAGAEGKSEGRWHQKVISSQQDKSLTREFATESSAYTMLNGPQLKQHNTAPHGRSDLEPGGLFG